MAILYRRGLPREGISADYPWRKVLQVRPHHRDHGRRMQRRRSIRNCRWSDSDSDAEADCLRYNDDDLHNRNKVTTKRLSSESSNHCHHYTSEFIILSKKQKTWIDGTPYSQQTSFCAPGDSGSLIIHQDGSICGLLYGEVTGWWGPGDDDTGNLYVGAGVVSYMSKVMASIEQSTIRLDASGNRGADPAELGLL